MIRKGFTLIEILTVLTIVILISLISVAFLRTTQPSSTLNSAVQNLITDIRYASELSTATQVNHRVQFSTDRYSIIRLSEPNFTVKEILLTSPLQISGTTLTNDRVEFNTLGAANENGTVTLLYNADLSATIDIRPSGYVRLQ